MARKMKKAKTASYLPSYSLSDFQNDSEVLAELVPGAPITQWARCVLRINNNIGYLERNGVPVGNVIDVGTGGTLPRIVPADLFSNDINYRDFENDNPGSSSMANSVFFQANNSSRNLSNNDSAMGAIGGVPDSPINNPAVSAKTIPRGRGRPKVVPSRGRGRPRGTSIGRPKVAPSRGRGRRPGPSYHAFAHGGPLSSSFAFPESPALNYPRQDRRGPQSPYYVPPVAGTDNLQTYKCPICEQRFHHRRTLEDHLKKHGIENPQNFLLQYV